MANDNYFEQSTQTVRGNWAPKELITEEAFANLKPLTELKPTSVLLEADGLIHGDRNQDYDHPLDNFRKTAKMWSVIFDVEVTEEQVAMAMVALKLARELHRHKRDNIVDGAGYFGTLDMVYEEKVRRGEI